MRKGFTLVELMIVIAIIAILMAIAIPNLISGRISANITSAKGTLKQLTSTEAIWLQQDPDGNGMKDHWTYDLSGMFRMFRANGTTNVAFIPLDVAQADARSAYTANPFGAAADQFLGDWTDPTQVKVAPKSGYWFTVLDYDDPAMVDPDNLYNQNEVVVGGGKATNHNRYGFMAAPDVYGSSGIDVLIVNELGTIWAVDPGYLPGSVLAGNSFTTPAWNNAPADVPTEPRWDTDALGTVLSWPGVNPASITVNNGGRVWVAID